MTSERKDGHSKLVYNKERRTIDKVDPHPMTGDGAVVRKAAIYYADDKVDMPLNVRLVARAYLAQAAEIERLTKSGVGLTIALDNAIRERFASEACNADLLKALKKLRSYNVDIRDGKINYRPEDHIYVADKGLAAAKETV